MKLTDPNHSTESLAISRPLAVSEHDHRFRPFALAGLAVVLLYSIHLYFCQRSTLQYMDFFFEYSDMVANLLWAIGIREQGWLNPVPYHALNDWMQSIAPYSQWVKWWGGEQIFQQSPLYAYLLSLFVHKYFLMRIVQALMSIGTCAFIGLLSARIAGRAVGWFAFWMAALYAPFYAYSWPYLREGLGWLLTAAVLWALGELTYEEWPSRRARFFGWLTGSLLGLGFLARETYLLLIPLSLVALCFFAWRRRCGGIVARVAVAAILVISPLVVRNGVVHAPLLSSSNRFAETFIHGNARGSHPYLGVIPKETGPILYKSQGRALPVIRETIASHPAGVRGWLGLQVQKFLSLFDPYESPDNLSFYFVAYVSPVVRFGLRYWMILPPALAGLALAIWRRHRTHMWLWLFAPVLLASLFIGIPFSRYRQSLAVLFIPWAAYFLADLAGFIRRREFRKAAFAMGVLGVGWGLMQGPLARQPRESYERPAEYLLSAQILHQLGNDQEANATLALVRAKFPGVLPPP